DYYCAVWHSSAYIF
nr:immunoglobulin light chain junction region [Macaca mulatta]MOX77605.1 immunoglobulin light chain junction region [Macaca mulatta]MOX79712.1 immunoglobulin light chain junction region [Macaca mulatta]MOX81140.1 immunoglobulin light chain junction region [Macaca mulatta]MOX83762.1 immunoglobulin light chain junction region [Macaca mulatta]